MTGVKISALPPVVSVFTTDIFPIVQAGVTSQATLAQVQTLFGFPGGILSLAAGGTSASLTASNGGIVASTTSALTILPTLANGVLVTNVAGLPSISSTLPLAVQSNITQLGAQTQALNMNSHFINNVTDPLNPQDAATKSYVDTSVVGAFLPLIGGTMLGPINMGNHKITNMADPTLAQDAVTLSFLNTTVGNFLPLSGGTMSGAINMNSHKITSLLDPTNPQDAATKSYVDTVAVGLAVQQACFAATTGPLTATYLNGASGIGATLTNAGTLVTFTTDGTTPPTNSRILVKDQTTTFQNGIYVLTNVGSGAVPWVLTRATDYDQPSEIQPGDLVIINNGTLFGGTSFIETASVSVIGTDPILFSQFTFSATAVLLKANNLSDVANKITSFNNISPTTTKGDLISRDITNNVRLAVGGSDGQILQVNSAAATGLAWSTATYPPITTINQLVYSSANNIVSGLATINSASLVTSLSGLPTWLGPMTNGQVVIGSTGAIPVLGTLTGGTNISITNSAGGISIASGATFTQVIQRTFSSSGTYTPTPGMKYCLVKMIGGGGAGGGTATTAAGQGACGGGGGSGAYTEALFAAVSIGASQTVTIGAGGTGVANAPGNNGGTSSLGALITSPGGGGGFNSGSTASTFAIPGGAGGGIGIAGPTFRGSPGTTGILIGTAVCVSGNGGSSILGGGAVGISITGNTSGGNAGQTNSGGGGSGSASQGIAGGTASGGAGGSGAIIIYEYI